jgi:hypothetical protein
MNFLDSLKHNGPNPAVALIYHEEPEMRRFFCNNVELLTFSYEEFGLILNVFGKKFFEKFEEMENDLDRDILKNERWSEPHERFLTKTFAAYNRLFRAV